MIVIFGALTDINTEIVCARLNAMDLPYRLFDLGQYPFGFQMNAHWRDGGVTGELHGPGWRVSFEQLSGAYVRYVSAKGHVPVPDLTGVLADAALAEAQCAVMSTIESLPCLVVNRAVGAMSNHSKPYQALLVRRAGLSTPRTLVTTAPEAARAFLDECEGDVIFKSLSGLRSIVRRFEARDLDRLHHLTDAPVQFQQFVPGVNVRVHTVGDRWFATRVHSDVVDYRFAKEAGHALEMESTSLPGPVAASCLALARSMGLAIAGIDLKETPDGRWYCFEVNPSPGFAYYEQTTGQPISEALGELLHAGNSDGVGSVAVPVTATV